MPGTPRQFRAGAAFGVVVGLAKIHEGYWLRPPPRPRPLRLLPFRKLFSVITLMGELSPPSSNDAATDHGKCLARSVTDILALEPALEAVTFNRGRKTI